MREETSGWRREVEGGEKWMEEEEEGVKNNKSQRQSYGSPLILPVMNRNPSYRESGGVTLEIKHTLGARPPIKL